MTKLNEVYKCGICGNIVEVLHNGAGELVCCGQPMNLFQENTKDAAQEKHVPVVEKINNGIKVKIGSIAHPMDDNHYIEWIEVLTDGQVYRKNLKPGDAPEAEFFIKSNSPIQVREYCNIHGLWKTDL
jgi:superoxide reductase